MLGRRELLRGLAGCTGWAFAAQPPEERPRQPLLSPDDARFLAEQARRVVLAARLRPGDPGGGRRNETGYTIRVPGGNMGYPAFWIRDAVMMLGDGLIPAEELEGWIRLICSTIRQQLWNVRPGVVVPAYSVADHINYDGKPTFYPGSLETGDKQGGNPFGKYPPLDDNFYFVTAVWRHWTVTRSTALLGANVRTAGGEMRLGELCERVYAAPQSDSATGLCTAGDVETENAKDFGFCDTINKSAKLLFASLLKFVAARQMAEVFRASGQPDKARHFVREADRIRAAIPATFARPAGNGEAWLHAATGVGNQPDVWGSAYAVWCGAVGGDLAQALSRALTRAYREKTAVREGCVRHILTTDPTNRGAWQSATSPSGEYQNGGYWGTASGWYIAALARTDRTAAAAMARDYIGFLRGHMRPDGMAEAWEWFNPDTGKNANPTYVATVALPWIALRQAGLIGA